MTPEEPPRRFLPEWLRLVLMVIGWIVVGVVALVVLVFGACFLILNVGGTF